MLNKGYLYKVAFIVIYFYKKNLKFLKCLHERKKGLFDINYERKIDNFFIKNALYSIKFLFLRIKNY